MKKAVVDIGTNSVRLLLAELMDGQIVKRSKQLIMTRLGKGMKVSGALGHESIEATLDALALYKEEWTAQGYDLVQVIATSAVRDASNRDELLVPAREKLGITIDVISGLEEAHLGYLGSFRGLSTPSEVVQLIVDIGGGSTEIIQGSGEAVLNAISLDMGAVRMTESFADPTVVHGLLIEDMQRSIQKMLQAFDLRLIGTGAIRVVGIGGTITTLGAVDLKLAVYNADVVHNHELTLETINRLRREMETMTLEERRNIIGLDPKRADIILAGTIILEEVLRYFSVKGIIVSDYDNLEGALYARPF